MDLDLVGYPIYLVDPVQIQIQNYTVCADFPVVVAQRHIFWGCTPRGDYDPQIRTRARFLYSAPIPQVSSSYVYWFGNYHVDKQTNKQTPLLFTTLRHLVIGKKLF